MCDTTRRKRDAKRTAARRQENAALEPKNTKSNHSEATQPGDRDTLMMMKRASFEGSAEVEISRDDSGGAARLLLTDNNHMLPSLIALIVSCAGAAHTGEQHAMTTTTHSVHAVLLKKLSAAGSLAA